MKLSHRWSIRRISICCRGRLWPELIACCVFPASLFGQAELSGRVLAGDSLRTPIRGAEVLAPQLRLTAVSDSAGRYKLIGLRAGSTTIITRALGYRPDTTEIETAVGEVVIQDITLALASGTTLASVNVFGDRSRDRAGKMAGFDERRRGQTGRFIDRAAIEKAEGRRLGGILSSSGTNVDIRRGGGGKAWAVSGRAASSGKCALCRNSKLDVLDVADIAAGAGVACYMDVWMDGVLVYDSTSKKGLLFDVNSVDPASVEGIEIYTSASEIPAQYNRTSGGCGAILIWTRA
jgi:hypothetical protein